MRTRRFAIAAAALATASVAASCVVPPPPPAGPPPEEAAVRWAPVDEAPIAVAGRPGGGVVSLDADISAQAYRITSRDTDGNVLWRTNLDGFGPTTTMLGLADGSVLVARSNDFPVQEAWLERFGSDGTPDVSFGDDGVAEIALPDRNGSNPADPRLVSALAVGPQGRIWVAAEERRQSFCGEASSSWSYLLRLDADGSTDDTFGGGTPLDLGTKPCVGGSSLKWQLPHGLALGDDGSAFVAGSDHPDVRKVLPDGSGFDPSFGDAGVARLVEPDVPGCSRGSVPTALTVLGDGTLIAGFHERPFSDPGDASGCRSGVVKLSEDDGGIDPTYAGDGFLETRSGSSISLAVSVRSDGGLVVTAPLLAQEFASPAWANLRYRLVLREYDAAGTELQNSLLPDLTGTTNVDQTEGLLGTAVDGLDHTYAAVETTEVPSGGPPVLLGTHLVALD